MKLFIGTVIGLILSLIIMDITNVVLDRLEENYNDICNPKQTEATGELCRKTYQNKYPKRWDLSLWLINPGIGLNDPLRGACIKSGSIVHGKEYRGRDYFECNKAQILLSDILYGEDGSRY